MISTLHHGEVGTGDRRGIVVKNNKARILALAVSTVSLAAATPVSAQLAAGTPASASVSAFYSNWTARPIWFRNGVPDAAIPQLVNILKRAPFDGLATGPQLATQVETALAQAQTGQA